MHDDHCIDILADAYEMMNQFKKNSKIYKFLKSLINSKE